jgi:hypothetical protein
MLIRVQGHARDIPSHFVEVSFSHPCDKSPEWLARKSSLQRFRLTRDQDADSFMKEFIGCVVESHSGYGPEPCSHLPMWKLVPGAELEELPFGQRVPNYRSVDLPHAPVV